MPIMIYMSSERRKGWWRGEEISWSVSIRKWVAAASGENERTPHYGLGVGNDN
jgi:hypothetical protein